MIEERNIRLIIYMTIFSLTASASFFFLGSPDVAMAEAAVGAFTTIFFVVCFEKYDDLKVDRLPQSVKKVQKNKKRWKALVLPLGFTVLLFGLFLYFMPDGEVNTYLKEQYLSRFMYEIGGENAVTAIYLGYRVYDTLFEALVLIISVIAVSHMSYSSKESVSDGRHSDVERSVVVVTVMRIVCAVVLLFGVYLIFNGHITAGGGFQGGLFIAIFFVCRYLIYNIYDLPIKKMFRLEEFIFFFTLLIVIFIVFLGVHAHFPPTFQAIYMVVMNLMIGLKVGCGFVILFYRFIAIERG
ncbi:MAG: DUF4040 domain-containing protein [Oscillospiraceae bacterium]|nr:DUF4040 domain-containing protein [Oscillospiraceae bacterium]